MARPFRRTLVILMALAMLAVATPIPSAVAATSGRVTSVTTLGSLWIRTGGRVTTGVRIQVRGTVTSAVATLRLVDAAGRLRWSGTRTRRNLTAATYDFSFAPSAKGLGLAAGVYTLEASAKAGSRTAKARDRKLFVIDSSVTRVPVSVIVRVNSTPVLDPSGAFREDTSTAMHVAADTQEISRLAAVQSNLHLTIALPPFLLDRWSRDIQATAATATEQTGTLEADALEAVGDAVAAGVPLLRAGYGEPDLSALASSPAEISRQIDAGDAARSSALVSASGAPLSTVATGFGVASGLIPAAAAAVLATHGVSFVVADAASVALSHAATVQPVPYRVRLRTSAGASTTMTVLVLDSANSKLLADPAGSDALAASLYTRAASKRGDLPVVIEVTVGAEGSRTSAIEQTLDDLALLPWVRLVDAPTAASMAAAGTATLRTKPLDPTPAPDSLHAAVVRARLRIDAFTAAAGSAALETATVDALLLSESRLWAGPSGSWNLASNGQAFAAAADAAAWSVLSKISISAPGVTLPGSDGNVPVSVTNDSTRTLHVVLRTRSSDIRVQTRNISARLAPGENILSVPVAMGETASGRLDLAITAGTLKIASASTTVSASYLDRIVLLIAAVLVLVVLLIVIRRRVARARAQGSDT